MPDEAVSNVTPTGFKLRHVFRGHDDVITRLAWAPDGSSLASASKDGTVRLWDLETGELRRVFDNDSASVYSVAWSPDGRLLALAFQDGLRIWSTETGELDRTRNWSGLVWGIAWSPDGQTLATGGSYSRVQFWDLKTGKERQSKTLSTFVSGSFTKATHLVISTENLSFTWTENAPTVSRPLLKPRPFTRLMEEPPNSSLEWSPVVAGLAATFADSTIQIYDSETLELRQTSTAPDSQALSVAWSPDGHMLASAFLDGTVRLWNSETGVQTRILEGHMDAVTCVAFSHDSQLLASKSLDDTVRLWRCDTWETVAVFHEPVSGMWFSGLAFHPKVPILATLGEKDTVIRIWDLDASTLLSAAPVTPSVHYTNAKVVLIGDSGVGKSGLGLVLSGHYFTPTESSHGRHVWTFDRRAAAMEGGRVEMHETLLWDLAGQPGYRLIHQLYFYEVALALIVFDSRSETDPFAGVRHWDRALRLAQRVQSTAAPPLVKFLIAARTDRGGIGVSPARIERLLHDMGFAGYFETSAKEGWGVEEVVEAIRQAIDWSALPSVSSTELFQQIKDFLVAEKEAGRLLSTADELYRAFLKSQRAPAETPELRSQFEVCIGRVASRGLIRRLSFGGLILLQPELLDAYASALVNAAKDEPDGLGSIAEEDARAGHFRMSKDERAQDPDQEKLLLIATVEELLRQELALRESADDGPYLVFPSQFTREWPDAPDPEGKAAIFEFEGPVLNVYATLAVRLSRSGFFTRKAMWKNAATYTATVGGTCGMFLRKITEGRGELTLFYNDAASEETRFQFEEYVHVHLRRRALQESIQRRRIFICPGCGETIPDRYAQRRRERGFDWINCGVCETQVSLVDSAVCLAASLETRVPVMDHAADTERERDTRVSSLQGKIATGDFDVFLCHNSTDKPAIRRIGKQLKAYGILPWLDEWELRPGFSWQKVLEEQISKGKSVAVCVGKSGIGPWQDKEIEAFLGEAVKRECPIIPVILRSSKHIPELPIFLRGVTWVNFRKKKPDPLQQLIWGITGERRT